LLPEASYGLIARRRKQRSVGTSLQHRLRVGFIRKVSYCNSLSGKTAERRCLDRAESQSPSAGVCGELAQQGVS
jgi:hypothetical protein